MVNQQKKILSHSFECAVAQHALAVRNTLDGQIHSTYTILCKIKPWTNLYLIAYLLNVELMC